MHYIYAIINKINGKLYIGQTNNPKKRWMGHKYHSKNNNSGMIIHSAIRKYGIQNFSFEIIEDNILTLDEVNSKEEWWIKYCQSNIRNFGYNISSGGYNGTHLAGENSWKAKLTNVQAKKIRELFDSKKYSFNDLAGIYSVTDESIRDIIYNETYYDENYLLNKDSLEQAKNIAKSQCLLKISSTNSTHTTFSENDIINIRNLYTIDGYSCNQISEIYNIHKATTLSIIRLKTFKNISADYDLEFLKEIAKNNLSIAGQKQGKLNRGENHGRAKYSDEMIIEILNEYSTGKYTQKELANKYNLIPRFICKIVNEKRKFAGFENVDFDKIYKITENIKKTIYNGSLNNAAKINENDVVQIRLQNANGITATILAKIYKLSISSICNIINKKTWKHVK